MTAFIHESIKRNIFVAKPIKKLECLFSSKLYTKLMLKTEKFRLENETYKQEA